MRSPSFNEFQTIIQYLHEELSGAQLQEVSANEEGLILGFYRFVREPKTVWLVIDLDMQFPFVGMFEQNPWPKLKKAKPVALFLNSHFKNTYLKDVRLLDNFGRVAEFDFSVEGYPLVLQLRLIPKQPNVIVSASGKTVSWNKPKDLAVVTSDLQYVEQEQRSIHFIFKQWFERRAKFAKKQLSDDVMAAANSPYEKWLKQRRKDKEKKLKALSQIREQMQEMQKIPWSDIGDYLKTYGFKNLPLEWTQHVQLDSKVSQNIELCFNKMKQVEHKLEGARKRLEVLQNEMNELDDLSEARFQIYLQQVANSQKHNLQRKAAEGQFRKLLLDADQSMVVLMGKSASDNLKLLRQAKSWDLWIHLKDYPSAYAILQKNKDAKVSDAALMQASQWLVKESLKSKKNLTGVKVAVVVTECRHVRPIKGDKLGRVTYHHPRELLLTV